MIVWWEICMWHLKCNRSWMEWKLETDLQSVHIISQRKRCLDIGGMIMYVSVGQNGSIKSKRVCSFISLCTSMIETKTTITSPTPITPWRKQQALQYQFTQTEPNVFLIDHQMTPPVNQRNQILLVRRMLNCKRERRPYGALGFWLRSYEKKKIDSSSSRQRNAKWIESTLWYRTTSSSEMRWINHSLLMMWLIFLDVLVVWVGQPYLTKHSMISILEL